MPDELDIRTTIGDLLDSQTEQYADREALVHVETGTRYTYLEFKDECDRVARGLMALGIEKGQHVGIWVTNYTEWVVAQFATAKIGAVLVTVNPSYRTHELEYVLKQSEANALILIGKFRTSDYVAMASEVIPELKDSTPGELKCSNLPFLRNVVYIPSPSEPGASTPDGMWSWEDVRRKSAEVSETDLAQRQASCDPDDTINIQYTSGTTGNPKGAMLTHYNLVANGYYSGEGMKFTEEDRLCIPVPFYHCFGCVLSNLACVSHGSTMVIPSEYFEPLKALEAIQQEKCTALHGVPTMFIAQLGQERFSEFDLSSLRTGMMAGSPCPIEVMRQVVDQMGVSEITIAYGQTEASPVITLTRTEDTLERRVSTVGTVLPNVEVKLVDPETGADTPAGEQGELLSRSFMVMKGYYNLPDATASAIDKDGWLHTGDLATVDKDGYYRITGRLKDMIIRGGENVYPREVEEFLYTHPKVADVQVIGVPDERFVEEVMAWVMLKPGETADEEEIREYCKGKIAHYKIPRYVKMATEFPMTVTGKIQKFKMREVAIEELGLQKAAGIETA
ncbi:MAG: AMP-binding protein [Chloroflexi bacterium]|nr:AMP-binding protein [Chloroflexota bacterium]MDP6497945.1 AMP-binding protein [Dehalococcoidia bacterium]|tara:strand:- start:2487 stop:4178 length:1692 start_codon:yes stop_codon:yes gene_type:complete